MANFRRGSQGLDALNLPEADKLTLCEQLLAEFGAENITRQGDELVHSCTLPHGLHAHGDVHPSASLNYAKLVYKCLGCGSGGGLLWWIAECRGETTEGARKHLRATYTDANHPRTIDEVLAALAVLYTPTAYSAPLLPTYSPKILAPWRKIHPYLTEIRHVRRENVIAHQVGYDEARERIVFPHFWKSHLVGWQSRRIFDDGSPKYQFTPEFPKSHTTYNHRPGGDVVVVESPMSVVAKGHLIHMEATFGASVSVRQLHLLAQHRRVILCYDNDDAGWEATARSAETLGDYGPVWVAKNPYAADPADMDDGSFLQIVKTPVPYAVWEAPRELLPWELPTGGGAMSPIQKHGSAERIIEDEEDAQGVAKTASKDWSERDDAELARENSDD